MGGKTWSREEELYFWRIIVPLSPKAAVQNGKPLDWEQLSVNMQQHFGANARRRYTNLMLYEHYFQNVTTGHKSPKAYDLVLEHWRDLGMVEQIALAAKFRSDTDTETHGKDPNEVASGERKPRTRQHAKRKKPADPTNSADNPLTRTKARHEAAEVFTPILGSESRSHLHQSKREGFLLPRITPMNDDGSGHIRREPYIPPAVPMSAGPHAYQTGPYSAESRGLREHHIYGTASSHPHPGPAFFNEVVWNKGTDSGYASVSTSSLGGSPTSPAAIGNQRSSNDMSTYTSTSGLAK